MCCIFCLYCHPNISAMNSWAFNNRRCSRLPQIYIMSQSFNADNKLRNDEKNWYEIHMIFKQLSFICSGTKYNVFRIKMVMIIMMDEPEFSLVRFDFSFFELWHNYTYFDINKHWLLDLSLSFSYIIYIYTNVYKWTIIIIK